MLLCYKDMTKDQKIDFWKMIKKQLETSEDFIITTGGFEDSPSYVLHTNAEDDKIVKDALISGIDNVIKSLIKSPEEIECNFIDWYENLV